MDIPPEFISNIQNTFREEGHAFLDALPNLIAEASARWGLTDVVPSPELSYNFVAFAKSSSLNRSLRSGRGGFENGSAQPRDQKRDGGVEIV